MAVRKLGVEEELQLVDPDTGQASPVSDRVVEADTASWPDAGHEIEQELFLHQLELETDPWVRLDDLERNLRERRRRAAEAAQSAGAIIVAVPTPVLRGDISRVTRKARYERIVRDFGIVGREASVAGMHVHVDVSSDAEAIGVLDRIRPWLPVLLAISANSPYWLGVDSGYASWRAQVWGRWPTAGHAEPYGDPAGYRAATQALLDSGAAGDRGMLYLDARVATDLPTVEIRVADVCTDVEIVCLVAALARALVETAGRAYTEGSGVPVWRSDLLRAAHWKASRYGLGHDLLHPVERGPVQARQAVEALIAHTRVALADAGDLSRVRQLFEWVIAHGSGAARQRAVVESGGDLRAVVADLAERTRASWSG